jgi:hypothetical protein
MFTNPKSLTFKIPIDHPRAPRLRAIFDKLATSRQRLSGLVIESGRKDDAAVEYVLGELRELLLEDGVNLSEHLERELHRKPDVSDLQGLLSSPVLLASIFTSVLDKEPRSA